MMAQMIDHLKESPSQTAGPYVHIGCTPNFSGLPGVYPEDLGTRMFSPDTRGERITLTGAVWDGTGTPLKDALVEIWQADANGHYPGTPGADPSFTGFGRSPGDMTTGEFTFQTIKPGPLPFRSGAMMAPHITFWIVARGINLGLHTRMYFEDEPQANNADPILTRIEHQNRLPTLLARKDGDTYRFDIRLQGPDETIFFDV